MASFSHRSLFDTPDTLIASMHLAEHTASGEDEAAAQNAAARALGRNARSLEAEAAGASNDGDSFTAKTAPGVTFASREELREHCKSDWHKLNLRRIAMNLPPVSEEQFQETVEEYESSLSGSNSDEDLDDVEEEEGDEEELQELLQAQATLGVRKVSREESDDVRAPKAKGNQVVEVDWEGKKEGERVGVFKVLLPKGQAGDYQEGEVAGSLLQLKTAKVAYLFASGGHFAACVYQGTQCLQHKTFHRYVIRAKAGTRQATRDAMGGSSVPKSAGSSIRRYNEAMLQRDIDALLQSWQTDIKESERVFVFAPGSVNSASIFSPTVLTRNDGRVRPVPFNVRRPTLREVARVHCTLMSFVPWRADDDPTPVPRKPAPPEFVPARKRPTAAEEEAKSKEEPAVCVAAGKGQEPVVKRILSGGGDVNEATAGGRTALHCAALAGMRDPHGKAPYELCKDKEARDAFRRFAAAEPAWWDYAACSIPSALTQEMEEEQKQKEAQRKEKEKARRKEQEKRKKEREKQKKEEEAAAAKAAEAAAEENKLTDREKRALAAEQRMMSMSGGPSGVKCSCCNKPVMGRPFERLAYKYCSTACVTKHRQQLGA